MAKKRTSMLDTLKPKGTSDLKKRMKLVDQIAPPATPAQPKKRRTLFYLSVEAIEALNDIVYILKKIDDSPEKTKHNNSTVVDTLIKVKRAELNKTFASAGGFNALD